MIFRNPFETVLRDLVLDTKRPKTTPHANKRSMRGCYGEYIYKNKSHNDSDLCVLPSREMYRYIRLGVVGT